MPLMIANLKENVEYMRKHSVSWDSLLEGMLQDFNIFWEAQKMSEML